VSGQRPDTEIPNNLIGWVSNTTQMCRIVTYFVSPFLLAFRPYTPRTSRSGVLRGRGVGVAPSRPPSTDLTRLCHEAESQDAVASARVATRQAPRSHPAGCDRRARSRRSRRARRAADLSDRPAPHRLDAAARTPPTAVGRRGRPLTRGPSGAPSRRSLGLHADRPQDATRRPGPTPSTEAARTARERRWSRCRPLAPAAPRRHARPALAALRDRRRRRGELTPTDAIPGAPDRRARRGPADDSHPPRCDLAERARRGSRVRRLPA